MNDQDEIFEAATETPVSLGCPSLVPSQVIAHDEPAAEVPRAHGIKIADRVRLVRFRAGGLVKMIGTNQVEDANHRHIYEITVAKAGTADEDYVADCFIDGASVLQIFCTSRSRLEKVARSAFRRYLWTNKKPSQRRAAKRRAQEKGGAE